MTTDFYQEYKMNSLNIMKTDTIQHFQSDRIIAIKNKSMVTSIQCWVETVTVNVNKKKTYS